MPKPDLVIRSKEGRVIAVVEAKSRPVSRTFESPVYEQLRNYTNAVNGSWAVLVDPETTRIFRQSDLTHPWVTFSTGEILESVSRGQLPVIGERTLLVALNRWLKDPRSRTALVARYPSLGEFFADVGVTSTEEWSPTAPEE
jgi:hypothetical protein